MTQHPKELRHGQAVAKQSEELCRRNCPLSGSRWFSMKPQHLFISPKSDRMMFLSRNLCFIQNRGFYWPGSHQLQQEPEGAVPASSAPTAPIWIRWILHEKCQKEMWLPQTAWKQIGWKTSHFQSCKEGITPPNAIDWYFYKITENGNSTKISVLSHVCIFFFKFSEWRHCDELHRWICAVFVLQWALRI